MIDRSSSWTRSERVVVKEAGGEVVVYDLDTDQVHLLAPLASSIWRLTGNPVTAQEIHAQLVKMPEWAGISEEIVDAALLELQEFRLLAGPTAANGHQISRRTLLKAAGAAGLAAPILTTILAPTPAAAVSPCIANGFPCTDDTESQCCSQNCDPETRVCSGCIPFGRAGCPENNCCNGVTCTARANDSFCCQPDAAPCTPGSTNECCSGACQDNSLCPGCLTAGNRCTADRQCCSGACVSGSCSS